MKYLLTLLIATSSNMMLNAQIIDPPTTATSMADLKFEEETFDFGKIKWNVPVTHIFKFTNTGSEPLIISNVKAGCGCTTPDWTKQPIPPGKTGYVSATFNAAASGQFGKAVTVTSNTSSGNTNVLTIKGTVDMNISSVPQAPEVKPSEIKSKP